MGTEFGVLGPLEVRHDGRPVAVPAGGARVVLATLLLRANRVVPVDDLVERVWGDAANARAKATLQMTMTRLRQALGPANVIRTTASGYVAEVPDGALDLDRFRALAAQGRFAEALALWRDTPLSDVRSDLLHHDEVAPLLEERLGVLERRIDADLDAGRAHELVAELRAFVKEHPLREHVWGQLMLALYRSDQQAEALAAYRAVSRLLAEELGVDPGPALQEIHQRILTGDPTLRPATRKVPRHLPPDIVTFSGRADDLAVLDALLPDRTPTAVVISAIAGIGGVGKTALAVHWSHRVRDRFPDGQLFVDFRGYSAERAVTSQEALSQVLRGLGVPAGDVPVGLDEQVALYRTLLADRRVLVVLDNASSPDQVRPLLPANPDCLVVVTSRSDLRGLAVLNDAHVHVLGMLLPADALALLRRVIGDRRVAAEPEAAAELLRLCAHLPLAIRIIAADLAQDPAAGLADRAAELRAADRLGELAVPGDPDAAVRTAFARSYAALDDHVRVLFRRLGLVPGADFTEREAAVLADVPVERVRAGLEHLVGVSLVEERPGGRFALHDLLRLYAAERARAEDGPECAGAADRLFAWQLGMVDAAARLQYPGILRLPIKPLDDPDVFAGPDDAQAWLAAEEANLVATIAHVAEHGPSAVAWNLASSLTWYFRFARADASWRLATGDALRAARADGNRLAEAVVLGSIGTWAYSTGDMTGATEHFQQAVDIFRDLGELDWEGTAANNLGATWHVRGDLEHASRHLGRALEVKRELGSVPGQATVLLNLGVMSHELGRLRVAEGQFAEALALYRSLSARTDEMVALANLGSVLLEVGDLEAAAERTAEAVAVSREAAAGKPYTAALSLQAEAELGLGHVDRARELVGEALDTYEEVPNPREEIHAWYVAAKIALHVGDLAGAVDMANKSLGDCTAVGILSGEVNARLALAQALRRQGARVAARAELDRAFALVAKGAMGLRRGQLLTESARLHLLDGDLDRARYDATEAVRAFQETGQRREEARARRVLAEAGS